MFITSDIKVWICNEPTDMRKSIDGLSMMVADSFNLQPANGELFLFYNQYRDKLKILYCDTIINDRQARTKKMQWTRIGANNVVQIKSSRASNSWDIDWQQILGILIAA